MLYLSRITDATVDAFLLVVSMFACENTHRVALGLLIVAVPFDVTISISE